MFKRFLTLEERMNFRKDVYGNSVLYRLCFSFCYREISFITMMRDHPNHQTTKENT